MRINFICLCILLFQSCSNNANNGIYYLNLDPCKLMPKNIRTGSIVKVDGDTLSLVDLNTNRTFEKVSLNTGESYRRNKPTKVKTSVVSKNDIIIEVKLPTINEHLHFVRDEAKRINRLQVEQISKKIIATRLDDIPLYIMLPEFGSTFDSEGKFMNHEADTVAIRHWEKTNMRSYQHYDRLYMKKGRDTTFVLYQESVDKLALYLVTDWDAQACNRIQIYSIK